MYQNNKNKTMITNREAIKILESLDHTHNPLFDMLRTKTENESYSDFIKRISKLKGGINPNQDPEA